MYYPFVDKIFVDQHYKHFTIAKKSYSKELVGNTMELYYDSIFYVESYGQFETLSQPNLDNAMWFKDISHPLIIILTVVGCILSFSLGLLIRYNMLEQKLFLKKVNKANRKIFVVESGTSWISQSTQNEK